MMFGVLSTLLLIGTTLIDACEVVVNRYGVGNEFVPLCSRTPLATVATPTPRDALGLLLMTPQLDATLTKRAVDNIKALGVVASAQDLGITWADFSLLRHWKMTDDYCSAANVLTTLFFSGATPPDTTGQGELALDFVLRGCNKAVTTLVRHSPQDALGVGAHELLTLYIAPEGNPSYRVLLENVSTARLLSTLALPVTADSQMQQIFDVLTARGAQLGPAKHYADIFKAETLRITGSSVPPLYDQLPAALSRAAPWTDVHHAMVFTLVDAIGDRDTWTTKLLIEAAVNANNVPMMSSLARALVTHFRFDEVLTSVGASGGPVLLQPYWPGVREGETLARSVLEMFRGQKPRPMALFNGAGPWTDLLNTFVQVCNRSYAAALPGVDVDFAWQHFIHEHPEYATA